VDDLVGSAGPARCYGHPAISQKDEKKAMNGNPLIESIDLVEAAFREMARDPGVRSRLALISALSRNGERVWASELVYQLWRAGVVTRSEHGGRIDLIAGGGAFEIKSSRASYALKNSTKDDIDKWFLKDIISLQAGGFPGHFIITMATLGDRWGLSFAPPGGTADLRVDRETGRRRALEIYSQYAANYSIGSVRHVDLGVGQIPGRQEDVRLDALMFCVTGRHC
jgi:hypothetical protein